MLCNADFNLTYQEMDMPSSRVRAVFVAYSWIINVFNGLLFAFTVYIVVTWSAKVMGMYKWYIVISISNIVSFLTITATYEVEIFVAYPATLARGIVDFLQIPALAPFLQIVGFSLFEMHVIMTFCRFMFRYAQSTEKERITKVMSTKYFFVALLITYCFIISGNFYYGQCALQNGRTLQKRIPSDDEEIKNYFMSHVVTNFRGDAMTPIFEFLLFPMTLVFGGYCTLQCVLFQSNPKNKFSLRTKQMYRLLIYGLLIEQVAELGWFMLPYLGAAMFLPDSKKAYGIYLVYRVYYTYPTFVMVFTLTFYKRYRMGVRQISMAVNRAIIGNSTVHPSMYVSQISPDGTN
ncbi:unnamed protein product [Bursaphelenchus xylophilus]|uniref:(pine wood nematode) hypothetical protein n=1 Tax=Bursaphelenchus xylophilus TaxID=6326 RepID=A0A1I7S641_BURXY|nr:unnamed protein product [Bursaphelenchus xylophilus]CAG9082292.1 unnamed protein product [Bursaphelenchus xylophilus]